MRAYTPSGKIITGPVTKICHGIVANSIELEPSDINQMIEVLKDSPTQLKAILIQLRSRFVSERVGGELPVIVSSATREKYCMGERTIGEDMMLTGNYNYVDNLIGYTMDCHIRQFQYIGWRILSVAFRDELPTNYTVIMRRHQP